MKALFAGKSVSVPCYYRCATPARFIENTDWIALHKNPYTIISGSINHPSEHDYSNYNLIVIQQPYGKNWLDFINEQKSKGITVLCDYDDHIQSVKKVSGHRFKDYYSDRVIMMHEQCMKACDGIIASTEYLAGLLNKYNENIFVCENSLVLEDYDIPEYDRDDDYTLIGWYGGTGHNVPMGRWLEVISEIMSENEEVKFSSVGIDYASALAERHGKERCITKPWTTLENFSPALSEFDIIVGPSRNSRYFKSKSDLRWLQASALKKPMVADPNTYHTIEHGKTGLLASTDEEIYKSLTKLIKDKQFRKEIGSQAHDYVVENRSMPEQAQQWVDVFNQYF